MVVACGINNVWNVTGNDARGVLARWLGSWRVFRLATLIDSNLRGVAALPDDTARPELERVLRDGGKDGEEYWAPGGTSPLVTHRGNIGAPRAPTFAARLLRRDLAAMEALTARHGVQLVLLTYASFPLPARPLSARFAVHEHLNEEMRGFSRARGVVLVDVHDRFVQLRRRAGAGRASSPARPTTIRTRSAMRRSRPWSPTSSSRARRTERSV